MLLPSVARRRMNAISWLVVVLLNLSVMATPPLHAPLSSFAELVLGGAEDSAWFATYWQTKPWLLRREGEQPLGLSVSFSDVRALFDEARAQGTLDGRLALRGRAVVQGEGLQSWARVEQEIRGGASLSLRNSATRLDPRLAGLARTLEMRLGVNAEVNLYWTEAGSPPGFRPHWDSQDIFVFQLRGAKRWVVYGPPQHLLPYEKDKPSNWARTPPPQSEPILNATLRSGDVLYIPRGFYHSVEPLRDTPSLHATVASITEAFSRAELLRLVVDPSRSAKPKATGLPSARRRGSTAERLLGWVGTNPGRIYAWEFYTAVLDAITDDDYQWRRSVLPAGANPDQLRRLSREWARAVAGAPGRRVLDMAGADCDAACAEELARGLVKVIRRVARSGEAKSSGERSASSHKRDLDFQRLLQELRLRYFQGLTVYSPPERFFDCPAPGVSPAEVTLDSVLTRNMQRPANIIRLRRGRVALVTSLDSLDDATTFGPSIDAPLRRLLDQKGTFTVRSVLGEAELARAEWSPQELVKALLASKAFCVH